MLLNLGKQYADSEMEASLRDHKTIFETIVTGAGTRAEFVMLEHALIPLKQTSLLIQKLGQTTEDIEGT